ncbi:hypothetical protein [Pseudodesulfovibrio pelocollis]|uniref:hypothetical protein n=1 Tax=Pseudodesulfovibrio pelocollis TaxID=3051432 RepID=UPI00255B17B2|nr:hypothetical protein [Pseudodesulfovibrio sp. SB368]
MAQKQKIKFSRFRGKRIGLVRKRHGAWEEIQGEAVGFHVNGKTTIMLVSQDGLFRQCSMGWDPGLWMIAWVGEKPDQPKMDDLSSVKPRKRVDPALYEDFNFEEVSDHDLQIQVMAENIQKRGPGRPPKADSGFEDLRFGLDDRPDDLFDLTSEMSLGIGLEDEDVYDHLSFGVAEIY